MTFKMPEPVAWTTPAQLRNAARGFGAFITAEPKIHPEGETALFTADQVRAAYEQGRPSPCRWTYEGDPTYAWATGCGNLFQITDGTPEENQFKFCCYCGGAINLKDTTK